MANKVRPDIHQMVAMLSTKVKLPNKTLWKTLVLMIKYLNGIRKNYLTLSADYLKVIKCNLDASFAIHPDFKSHTGAIMTMGYASMQSVSMKQKLNKRISC